VNLSSIIIIEDDEVTALNLKLSLQKQGYTIVGVSDSIEDAKEQIGTKRPDIAIIDISLKEGLDGIELAKYIRDFASMPFIFLTSHSDDDIINEAIKTEPYGYIIKPFDPASLHATIQMAIFKFDIENKKYKELQNKQINIEGLNRLLNEKKDKDFPIVKFGTHYHLDLIKDEVFYKKERIALTKKEGFILKLLVARLGEIVSFKEAVDFVWKENEASENNIRTLIWRLRKKLPTDIIKNSSGIGYHIEK
jgi:DNA-binding response OmpR family regulator